MISMSTGFQGLTEAQCNLVQHWYSQRSLSALPKREALDPGAIKAQLASLSIVEIAPTGDVKFRLAGSSLRRIFGIEMRGRCLSELSSDIADMWSLGLASALERCLPTGGVIQREDDCHTWLRLPLEATRNGALVLCHDALLSKARFQQEQNGEYRRKSNTTTMLAA